MPADPVQGRGAGDHRHVFICGLHRSGTSLIARTLAGHPAISGFHNTGAIEDEGQFLQSVFPVENDLGGVGRFGFDPRAHLVEGSDLDHPENAARLTAEWSRHWDLSREILVEKTPSNLLRMRMLQSYFPQSHFIVVTRHPVASALATLKWTEGNLFSLLFHWVHCYRLARQDASRINRIFWMSYEAFTRDPKPIFANLAEFLGIEDDFGALPPTEDRNSSYFQLWRNRFYHDGERKIAQKPPERPRAFTRRIYDRIRWIGDQAALPPARRQSNLRSLYDGLDAAAVLEDAVNEFGYSLRDLGARPPY